MDIWIDTNTGTWGALEGVVILNMDDLTPEQQEVLIDDHGDSDINALGKAVGKRLLPMLENSGFGDLTFSNCVAYSPQALRDEAVSMREGFPLEEELEMLEWVSNKATNEELQMMGAYALSGDKGWVEYYENALDAMHWGFKQFKDSSKKPTAG